MSYSQAKLSSMCEPKVPFCEVQGAWVCRQACFAYVSEHTHRQMGSGVAQLNDGQSRGALSMHTDSDLFSVEISSYMM